MVILFISIISFIGAYYFLAYKNDETITKKTLIINNCKVDYVHFKNNNIKKTIETNGHAFDNTMELGQAKIAIGKCLCDKYLNKKTAVDSIQIVKILNSEEYTYIKNLFYDVENFITDTLKVESVCKKKDKHFGVIIMD